MGIIGMKLLAKGAMMRPNRVVSVQEAISYVLSLPVSTSIIGFDTVQQVEEAVRIAKAFTPLAPSDMARLEEAAKPYLDRASHFKRA
jgi:aryl-alcohol dehydrogenase-like predicted oxidoreductase